MAIGTSGTPAIPGFEYLSVLGSGGFSDVLLYQQKLPRRRVAVKVLHVDQLDRQARRQFVAEANLMAQLSSHPAIATIYAADITADGQPYLVMEYCSGGSLGATYRANPLDVPEVLRVGIRLASALEAAHRLGIVHRDMKPANILITDYGVPVLTDFGISVGDDGVAEASMFADQLTATATSIGSGSTHGMSVPWAPPEAFEDEPLGDERSDIYSLGATLFSLLEGRTPFEIPGAKNGPVQLSRRIEKGELNPSARTDVPASLQAAMATAMAVSRSDRFASALAFAEVLQAVQAEIGEQVTPIELPVDPTTGTISVAATPGPADESERTRIRTVAPVAPVAPVTPPTPVEVSGVAPAAQPVVTHYAPNEQGYVAPQQYTTPQQSAAPPQYGPPQPHTTGAQPPRSGNGGRIALIATAAALAVILLGVGAVVGVSALVNNLSDTSNSNSSSSRNARDDDEDDVEDDPTPTETFSGDVAICDDDIMDTVKVVWEVEDDGILAYDQASDQTLTEAGLTPACGYFLPDSSSGSTYTVSSMQVGYFEGTDENVAAVVAAYDAAFECTGPNEYETMTTWSCNSDYAEDLVTSMTIRHIKAEYAYDSPEVIGEYESYVSVSLYVYDYS